MDNRDRVWIHYNQTFICKLRNGLTRDGHIRRIGKYREELEYEIKRTWGELQGPEVLDYEAMDDGLTSADAKTYMGRGVGRRQRDADADEGEEGSDGEGPEGTVVEYILPPAKSRERIMRFRIRYDDDEEDEIVTIDQLRRMIS